MTDWVLTIVILSLVITLSREFLPKGARSPLFGPFQFLASLILVVSMLSPLFRFALSSQPWQLPEELFSFQEEGTEKTMQLLLKRSGETMAKDAKEKFPDAVFSLTLHSDKNGTPTELLIACTEEQIGLAIAQYLEMQYGIPTKVTAKEVPSWNH
jgi:hypothetical protein